jgi:hypothetical protein
MCVPEDGDKSGTSMSHVLTLILLLDLHTIFPHGVEAQKQDQHQHQTTVRV